VVLRPEAGSGMVVVFLRRKNDVNGKKRYSHQDACLISHDSLNLHHLFFAGPF
jgi:hypothetical protein